MVLNDNSEYADAVDNWYFHSIWNREQSPITEVEPYIPFNINPAGMQPILTTSYLLALPSILARF